MKIQSSDIQLSSSHYYQQEHKIQESLQITANRPTAPAIQGPPMGRVSGSMVSISRFAVVEFQKQLHSKQVDKKGAEIDSSNKYMQIKLVLEKVLGQKIDLIEFDPEKSDAKEKTDSNTQDQGSPSDPASGPNVSLDYRRVETYSEAEQTSFQAGGTVKTQDGKEIQFKVDLLMERAYAKEESVRVTIGKPMVDPLVINLKGSPAKLLDETMQFDLNSDGTQETIHRLAPESGYLVYDGNGDGKVNDGSELFGPSTGQGFMELAQWDQDGNGWIDENDSVFHQLSIWVQDGDNQLQSLQSAGVGAIYLSNVNTEFQMKDLENQTLGQIDQTGIFLKESGEVGTIQEVDLATEEVGESSQQA